MSSDGKIKRKMSKLRSTIPSTQLKAHSYPKTVKDQQQDEIDELLELASSALEKLAEKDIDICTHKEKEYINGQEVCCECGLHLDDIVDEDQEWRYYGSNDNKNHSDPSRVQYRKTHDKGIRKDLEKLQFPQQVINISDKYYNEITNGEIKRGNLRKGIIFACLYEAYKDLGKHQTPEQLQKILCITKKDMSKGLTYFNVRKPKREKKYITAAHFIPKICERFNCKQEIVDEVLELYNMIKSSHQLNHSYPQSVACGCIFYVFRKRDKDISASEFGKKVELSEITVMKKANEIDEVLTQQEVSYG